MTTIDTLSLNCDSEDFNIRGGLLNGRVLYEFYEEEYMPRERPNRCLSMHACKNDITLFNSPFDSTAIYLLKDLNAPAYKIAPFEGVDLPLFKYVASTSKPMINSSGMADAKEIQEAIDGARYMIERFGLATGLSD